MKKVDVILGLQWGDEGKGKVVDVLTPHYEVVARFQGGPNAGHTLEFGGEKYVLRSIPSGIFQGGKTNIIGNGVVLDAILFRAEAEELARSGHDITRQLCISKKAHLILPTHRMLDAAYEAAKGSAKIGTTGKGIGPTYTDKVSRNGMRVGDLLSPDFEKIYAAAKARHERILQGLGYEYDITELEKQWFEAVEYLRRFRIIDSEYFVNESLRAGKSILAEGAQGTLLDVDFGSYPFVTSSNTVCAGVCTGLGVALTADKVAGVRALPIQTVDFARLAREHNDANVICLSGRFVSLEDNEAILDTFLTTEFAGGRHAVRVEKIMREDDPDFPGVPMDFGM